LLQLAPPQLSRFVPIHPVSSRSNRLTPQPTDSIHNHHEAPGVVLPSPMPPSRGWPLPLPPMAS
jgi:hypothetical protein